MILESGSIGASPILKSTEMLLDLELLQHEAIVTELAMARLVSKARFMDLAVAGRPEICSFGG